MYVAERPSHVRLRGTVTGFCQRVPKQETKRIQAKTRNGAYTLRAFNEGRSRSILGVVECP